MLYALQILWCSNMITGSGNPGETESDQNPQTSGEAKEQ